MPKYETPWNSISGIILADKNIAKENNLNLVYVLETIWTHTHT